MSTRLDDRLGYLLKAAAQALARRMEAATREAGLSLPQYATLAVLRERPGLANADLARAAFVTPQSMGGVLAGLERAGLVRREADPAHGRRRPTVLTDAGASRLAEAERGVAAVEAALDAGADGNARGVLRGLLQAMAG